LIADYFGPDLRGKVYGILQLAQPLGFLAGLILGQVIAPMIGGWRSVFYITGALGLVVALLIYFGVKEMPRGKAEPEFENLSEMATFRFSWSEAREIFKKRTCGLSFYRDLSAFSHGMSLFSSSLAILKRNAAMIAVRSLAQWRLSSSFLPRLFHRGIIR
jgi:MFS family permease